MITLKDEKGHSQVWPASSGNRYRAQRRRDLILSSLKANSHVLELGCGAGDLTEALLNAGHRVTALDRSESMLRATLTACHHHPALVTVQSEVLSFLEKEGAIYDAVVGMGILHHCVLDFDKTLRMIASRLSVQGRGFFWEPNGKNPFVRFLFGTSMGRQLISLEPEEDAFTRDEILRILKNIYPRYRVEVRDWAYPFIPVRVQKMVCAFEAQAPMFLRNRVSQSLWIEFYKSLD